jgi:hypothetical protein
VDGPKISRLMVGLSALALGGFGIFQLWSGITTIFQFG